MKLKIRKVIGACSPVHIKRGYDTLDELRRYTGFISEQDTLIMLIILGNRHLANLAHFSPEKTRRSGTLKKIAKNKQTC